ncbi:MAG TPA: AAA family ATPase [Solirubrobacter sp.]|nr:AAA family ATPase [Solirubrobacter sp.]
MTVGLPDDVAATVVGRRRELRLLLGALERGKAVLLIGLPGVSKTTMLRALARHLGDEPDRFVDVTGDEQLTGHALVGTFDPPMVLKEGYRPEHFVPGPLARAMRAGGILYLEEMNRAPSGALNVLMTALSERYLEVPRLGRIEAREGFTVVGAANPLDDVGTTRLSRGLVDRFVTLELDYQTREEELAIVGRRCGTERAGFHAFAVDLGRASREHPDLRHGASIRGAIDFADLLAGWEPEELDLDGLRFLACSAYAGKLRVKPSTGKTATEIVHELIDMLLQRDFDGSVETLLERARRAPQGVPAEPDEGGDGPADGDTLAGGDRPSERPRTPDEIPGLARPGTGDETGESRSVPMVGRDRPSSGGTRLHEPPDPRDAHLRDPEAVLRHARELTLRLRDGVAARAGAPGTAVLSRPWSEDAPGPLALEATVDAFLANSGRVERDDFFLEARSRHRRDYVILVDHSGSMVGRKLVLAATLAAALAQLSAAGRADYGVIAFDDELKEIKPLGVEADVEQVVDRVLRLPEGRATDLGAVLLAAAEASDRLPDATDVVLISDCMPTKGVKTYAGLARLAARVPSLYIAFADERGAAIQMFGGERQLDLYQWWAQQWVGADRLKEFADLDDVEDVVDLLSEGPSGGGAV